MAETTTSKTPNLDRLGAAKFTILMLCAGFAFGIGWEGAAQMMRKAAGPAVVIHAHYDAETE
ncbi:MAG: hypothetical protein VR70_05905 [Rhodospirillaceae bacterium BRH_c57]|nr:MAG: hypothetical protein VR70_05905 [Rhodospirillaceae bacterium BRH_c57]